MDNARKKYVNIERLSIGDIFTFLDSIENDGEEDIENIMNESDTELVAEGSTNIIRSLPITLEDVRKQSSSVSVRKHKTTFCLPKTKMKQTL